MRFFFSLKNLGNTKLYSTIFLVKYVAGKICVTMRLSTCLRIFFFDTVFPRFNQHVVESEIRRNLKKCFSSINDTSLTPGEITTPVVNHGEEEEVDNTGLSLFSDRFFRPTSDVSISEMVYPNYLKFDVRIVLYQVPFQIKFEVILTNGYRDIDLGSWPKKRSGKMQTIRR